MMMKLYSVRYLVLPLLILVCGCSREETTEAPNPWATAGDSAPRITETALNIGDVEQQVRLSTTTAEVELPPNYDLEVLSDLTDKVNFVALKVSPPFPQTLPIEFKANSLQNFGNTPAVIRARYTVEARFGDETKKAEGPLFNVVFGADGLGKTETQIVDVLGLFDETPNSLLILMIADGILMPAGTAVDSIDPATATSSPERMSSMRGNPMRVEFIREP